MKEGKFEVYSVRLKQGKDKITLGVCRSITDAEKFVEKIRKAIYDSADTVSPVIIDIKTKDKLLYHTRKEEKRLMEKYIPHLSYFEGKNDEDKNDWIRFLIRWDQDLEEEMDILKTFRIGDENKPLATNDAISLGSDKKFVVQMMSAADGEKTVSFPALIPITEEWAEYREKNGLWEYEPGDTVKKNNP